MSHSPAPPATAFAHAVTRAALQAGAASARTAFGAGLAALILTLLLRLLARTEAAWDILPDDTDEFEYTDDYGYTPYAIRMPTMGRAPHADYVEAGLVPGWVMGGVRNRGMRPAAAPARLRRRARPARAPPLPCFAER